MGDNQLYVANLPFQLSSSQIQDVIGERFPRPIRVVCLKRGPPVPYRRQSAYIHFAEGQKPSPTELEGWLPQCLRRMNWLQPLHCTEVKHAVSWLKQTVAQMEGHTGSCRGKGIHNLAYFGGRLTKLTCSCCAMPPECPVCVS